MTQLTPDSQSRLRVPTYLVLGSALIFALVDFFLAVAPLQVGNVMWRFGAVGLGANAIVTPLVLCVLIYALAVWLGDRAMIATIGVFAALLALYLLVAVGAFSLDALQMRSRVAPAAHGKFIVASAVAIVKIVIELVLAVVLAVNAFRANRATRRVTARGARASAPIIGARGGAMPAAAPAGAERDPGSATP
jgi:hypothetical protein